MFDKVQEVLLFFYFEFKSPLLVFGTKSTAQNLPSKLGLFLGSHLGLKVTWGVRMKK